MTPTTEAGRDWVSSESADLRAGDPDRAARIACAIEAEAAAQAVAAERERLLEPATLARAIHAYGGLCRSRYGRVTCGPEDHIVMATSLRAAVLALADPAEPEPLTFGMEYEYKRP